MNLLATKVLAFVTALLTKEELPTSIHHGLNQSHTASLFCGELGYRSTKIKYITNDIVDD
jgi:hypothetical protein